MDIEKEKTALDARRLELAAAHLQHLLRIQETQISLPNLVLALKEDISKSIDFAAEDLSPLLKTQINILDSLFNYYIEESKNPRHSTDDKLSIALKAQRQLDKSVATFMKLQKIKKSPNEGTN